jgi:sigma-B regulation protein RsbU (phosphoserine phosphatase)
VYNAETRELTYCNAGHNPPMLVRANGTIELLEKGGTLTGAFDWAQYEEEKVTLQQEERLVIFTDGVTEAADPTDEQFGEKRLEDLLKRNSALGAADLINRIVTDVLAFQKDAPVMDDITIVCLRT